MPKNEGEGKSRVFFWKVFAEDYSVFTRWWSELQLTCSMAQNDCNDSFDRSGHPQGPNEIAPPRNTAERGKRIPIHGNFHV